MAQPEQEINPLDMPIFGIASITGRDLKIIFDTSLSDILYDDGLDQLPRIALSLNRIADSLETLAITFEKAYQKLEEAENDA